MKPLSVLLGCLLLSSLSTRGNYDLPKVTQSPNMTMTEGDTVELECCWSENITRGRIKWIKSSSQTTEEQILRNDLIINRTCLVPIFNDKECKCAKLILPNVTHNNSGSYICTIFMEVPTLIEMRGSGTHLRVKPKGRTHGSLHSGLVPLTVLPVLIFIALLSLWALRKRRCRPASGGIARVIRETPHQEGEELENMELQEQDHETDQNSTSSLGSTQWCQVPMYESLNYFDVQKKNDG